MVERDRAEVRRLYANLAHVPALFADQAALVAYVRNFMADAHEAAGKQATNVLWQPLGEAIGGLLAFPPLFYGELEQPDFDNLSFGELSTLLNTLRVRERVLQDPGKYLGLWHRHMMAVVTAMLRHFPDACFEETEGTPFHIPLMEVTRDLPYLIEGVMAEFFADELVNAGLFAPLRTILNNNLARLSGVPVERLAPTVIVSPTKSGAPPEGLLSYLAGTPFADVFKTPVPFVIDQKLRYEGHWIVAPPGRGKTTLLSAMVANDLPKQASIIVMDSKGDLLKPLRDLDGIEDRLVILEPDANFPLALNPLDISKDTASLNAQEQRLRTNRVVLQLEQLFGGLFEAKMTALQSRFFRIVLRSIITAAPRPTLATFRAICQGGYEDHLDLAKLSEEDRLFFLKEFKSKTYADTCNQVLWQLGLLMDDPVFSAMFSAEKTKVDMGELMDSGKVVLISNSKAVLDDSGAEFFGRFFLALVRSAAQQRSRLDNDEKLPVFFYMDECQTVIKRDENIATIIDECRSQKIALIMAHQRVSQITSPNVLDALSNCALRFANSDEDARYLASGLRTSPEFLRQPRGSFAAFIRDQTETAISLRVPNVKLADFARMDREKRRSVIDRMRQQYCLPAPDQESATPAAPPPKPSADARPRPRPADPAERDDDAATPSTNY